MSPTYQPDLILTGDVNAHSTLWYSHTGDHRGQLISDIISNSEHITLNTDTPTRCRTQHYSRPPHQTSQHYTTAQQSTHAPNTNYNKTDTHSRTIGKQTGHSSLQTPRLPSLTFYHHQTYALQIHKHHSPRRQTQHPKRQDTLHMQTTTRTHKTQNGTPKQQKWQKLSELHLFLVLCYSCSVNHMRWDAVSKRPKSVFLRQFN